MDILRCTKGKRRWGSDTHSNHGSGARVVQNYTFFHMLTMHITETPSLHFWSGALMQNTKLKSLINPECW